MASTPMEGLQEAIAAATRDAARRHERNRERGIPPRRVLPGPPISDMYAVAQRFRACKTAAEHLALVDRARIREAIEGDPSLRAIVRAEWRRHYARATMPPERPEQP
jgi:hypothetical protein